jgi:hypothetical protein
MALELVRIHSQQRVQAQEHNHSRQPVLVQARQPSEQARVRGLHNHNQQQGQQQPGQLCRSSLDRQQLDHPEQCLPLRLAQRQVREQQFRWQQGLQLQWQLQQQLPVQQLRRLQL